MAAEDIRGYIPVRDEEGTDMVLPGEEETQAALTDDEVKRVDRTRVGAIPRAVSVIGVVMMA